MANALLDALGYVGDVLDKPGRAVRGLLGGRPEEAAAIVPFSDSMGLTDPANRVSGSDLLRNMGIDAGDGLGGTLAGIGVEMATDPLTWTGAGLGAMLGRKAGAAAVARGPRYGTTLDDMARMGGFDDAAGLAGANARAAETPQRYLEIERMQQLAGTPGIEHALRELPPGSSILGAGKEGAAFRTPADEVVRIGVPAGGEGRPITDMMLQPSRTVDFGNPGQVLRAERTPLAAGVGTVPEADKLGLIAEARGQGLSFWDKLPGNMGYHGGRPVVIDPGAVTAGKNFAGGFNPVVRHQDPGALMGRLLDMLGSDEAIRAGLVPSYTAPLARVGGAGGATLGGLGRLSRSDDL